MKNTRLILLLVIAVLIVLFFSFDLHQQLTLDSLKAQQSAIAD